MSEPLKYPQDIVDAFFKLEEMQRSNPMAVQIWGPQSAPHSDPEPSELLRLVETMLFASMATEEGHIAPVGVVFARTSADFDMQDVGWEIITLKEPQVFDVREVTKLAAACDFPRSFLAVMPDAGELKVVGIAAPRNVWLHTDNFVLVMAPRPGTVIIARDAMEVVRYDRGRIVPRLPPFLAEEKRQLSSIRDSLFGQAPHDSTSVVPDIIGHIRNKSIYAWLSSLVAKMSRLGHGGILAVLGPDDRAEKHLTQARALVMPVQYGEAIRQYSTEVVDAWRRKFDKPSLDARSRVEAAARRVRNMSEQLVRLTAVDGAVLLGHKLEVLGFGVKLPIENKNPPVVRAVNASGIIEGRWLLETKGTRHRAAATFAMQHPGGLAFVVSQDGDAGVLYLSGKDVVYWHLGVPIVPQSEGGTER